MSQRTYQSGQKFTLKGTTYKVKTAKENATAIEVASHAGQSLWVKIEQLERLREGS